MMAGEDRLFDQRIHDAYEGVVLSDEAQGRMLADLLAAQEAYAAGTEMHGRPTGAEHSDHGTSGTATKVIPLARRRGRRRWLMAAAAVAMALVVVRLSGIAPTGSHDKAASTADVAVGGGDQEAVTYKETEATPGDVGGSSDVSVEDTESAADITPHDTVDFYPIVRLGDGTTLSALVDAQHTVEVDASRVGESLGAASASPADAIDTVSCEVYRLRDDPEGYAVRYGDETTYWYCFALGE